MLPYNMHLVHLPIIIMYSVRQSPIITVIPVIIFLPDQHGGELDLFRQILP